MNATTKGTLLVKLDRANERIDNMADMFLSFEKNKKNISRDDFQDFIRSVHLILNTEFNDKGVERTWNN